MNASMKPAGSVNRFFCSWSGGKDSCLSLYRALQSGWECASLFTMIDENGERSRSHGLSPEALHAQAEAMGIPLRTAAASWDSYEKRFLEIAGSFREERVAHGVFGDIDLEPHRQWVERVCGEAGITPHLPLWQGNRRGLVEEFLDAGFKAIIVVVNTEKMPRRFLGRIIDRPLIGELESIGVDACGENGEFHTFVYEGPIFRKPITVTPGAAFPKDGYAFRPLAALPAG
jgi:diphthine-ammonia ligase